MQCDKRPTLYSTLILESWQNREQNCLKVRTLIGYNIKHRNKTNTIFLQINTFGECHHLHQKLRNDSKSFKQNCGVLFTFGCIFAAIKPKFQIKPTICGLSHSNIYSRTVVINASESTILK